MTKDCHLDAKELRSALSRAQQLAKRLGGDGKRRQDGGPWFCPLPENDNEPAAFLLAWKLDDNGVTLVASPHRLPWLEASCSNSADDETDAATARGAA